MNLDLNSWESVRSRIHSRFISMEWKPHTEILNRVGELQRHIAGPLVQTFYINTDELVSGSIVAITPQMLLRWEGKTYRDVIRAARENDILPGSDYAPVIKPLCSMLAEFATDDVEVQEEQLPPDSQVLVITNRLKFCGAVAAISRAAWDAVSSTFGSNGAYLIPSSRHEFLAVSKTQDPIELRRMLVSINHSPTLQEEDILSDNIYQINAHASLDIVL